MDLWTLLRLAKFISFALFAGGVMLATGPAAQRERIVAAWGLLPLGFFGSWAAGFGLLKATDGTMGAPWVSGSMLLSLGSLHLALLGSRPEARQAWRGLAARAFLGATIGAMVGRTAPGAGWVLLAGAGALIAAGIALLLARGQPQPPAMPAADGPALVLQGFWRLSRAEGLSAVALFLVYMPLKYGAGVVLDGGEGWFGLVHGILTLLYLNGLAAARRAGGWSVRDTALAFVSSLVPLGAFWFEARMRSRER